MLVVDVPVQMRLGAETLVAVGVRARVRPVVVALVVAGVMVSGVLPGGSRSFHGEGHTR